jgi:hypothetical protein
MFYYVFIKYFFHVKIKIFVMAKSDQDQDPHGSGFESSLSKKLKARS